jgi:hypothetical protein
MTVAEMLEATPVVTLEATPAVMQGAAATLS